MNQKWRKSVDVGKRIAQCRKECGIKSQDELSALFEKLTGEGPSRTTISRWERGDDMPSLEMAATLCEIFGCDMDYLACNTDTKRKENETAVKATGLSEGAVNALRKLKETTYGSVIIDFFSRLICDRQFHYAISAVIFYSYKEIAKELIMASGIFGSIGETDIYNLRLNEVHKIIDSNISFYRKRPPLPDAMEKYLYDFPATNDGQKPDT